MRHKDPRSISCWSTYLGTRNLTAQFWVMWRAKTFYELFSVNISVRTLVESWLIVNDLIRILILPMILIHLPTHYTISSVGKIVYSDNGIWIVVSLSCKMTRFLRWCRNDMTTSLHYARLEIYLIVLCSIGLYIAMKIHIGRVNWGDKITLVLCCHILWVEVSNRCDLDVSWANIFFFIAKKVISIVISVFLNLVFSWLLTPFELVVFLCYSLIWIARKANLLRCTLLSENVLSWLKLIVNLLLSWVDLAFL